MCASLVGKITVWRQAGIFFERHLAFLVSFAAGVLLVITYSLIAEAFEHSAALAIPWIIAGALTLLVAFRFIPDFHHHHQEGESDHTHSRISANRILASDGIHNIGDGVILAASFAVSPALGIATTASIFIHELVQEISEFFVLRQAGLSANRALFYNFLVSGTILIGAIGGYFLLEQFRALELPLLGLAAGSYLVVVFHDLIPHSVRASTGRIQYAKHFLWFLLGIALMSAVSYVFAHTD